MGDFYATPYISVRISVRLNYHKKPSREQLFMTLVKLRHNISFELLSIIKQTSQQAVIIFFGEIDRSDALKKKIFGLIRRAGQQF